MKLPFYTVNSFASETFQGNTSPVFLTSQPLPNATMQKIAFEMNQSVTAFMGVVGGGGYWAGERRFSLQWFTPTNELPTCGNCTLAATHVLYNHLGNRNEKVEFETLCGVLEGRCHDNRVVINFPAKPPVSLNPSQTAELEHLVKAVTGNLDVKEMLLCSTSKRLLVRLEDSCTRFDLESLVHDNQALGSLQEAGLIKGLAVTLRGELESPKVVGTRGLAEYHFISRYLAPWQGGVESTATGSLHTMLGPYWAKQLGTNVLTCFQYSKRKIDLKVTVRDDRVDLEGQAITVLEGTITI